MRFGDEFRDRKTAYRRGWRDGYSATWLSVVVMAAVILAAMYPVAVLRALFP